jgi:hypothetical protein
VSRSDSGWFGISIIRSFRESGLLSLPIDTPDLQNEQILIFFSQSKSLIVGIELCISELKHCCTQKTRTESVRPNAYQGDTWARGTAAVHIDNFLWK